MFLSEIPSEKMLEIFREGNVVTLKFPVRNVDESVIETAIYTGIVFKNSLIGNNGKVMFFDNSRTMFSEDAYGKNIEFELIEAVKFLAYSEGKEAYGLCSFIKNAHKINTAKDMKKLEPTIYRVIQ